MLRSVLTETDESLIYKMTSGLVARQSFVTFQDFLSICGDLQKVDKKQLKGQQNLGDFIQKVCVLLNG